MYSLGILGCFQFLFQVLDFPFKFKGKLLDILLSLFFEFFKLCIVLKSGFLKVSRFHIKSGFKFVNFATIQFLHSDKLAFDSFVLHDNILVLVKQVINLKLKFRDDDFLLAELIF